MVLLEHRQKSTLETKVNFSLVLSYAWFHVHVCSMPSRQLLWHSMDALWMLHSWKVCDNRNCGHISRNKYKIICHVCLIYGKRCEYPFGFSLDTKLGYCSIMNMAPPFKTIWHGSLWLVGDWLKLGNIWLAALTVTHTNWYPNIYPYSHKRHWNSISGQN